MMTHLTTGIVRYPYKLVLWRGSVSKTPQQRCLRGIHSEEHREKRGESAMRGIIVRVILAMLALVAVLHLPTQYVGAQEKFELEKAVAGAKTPADHEAIASYYDKEGTAAKAKAAEHHKLMQAYRNIAGKGQFAMEGHCQRLAQNYESIATENTALATAHRQMAQEAAQKK